MFGWVSKKEAAMRAHIAATNEMLEEAKRVAGELTDIAAGLIVKANGAYTRSLLARTDSAPKALNEKAPRGAKGETGEGRIE